MPKSTLGSPHSSSTRSSPALGALALLFNKVVNISKLLVCLLTCVLVCLFACFHVCLLGCLLACLFACVFVSFLLFPCLFNCLFVGLGCLLAYPISIKMRDFH